MSPFESGMPVSADAIDRLAAAAYANQLTAASGRTMHLRPHSAGTIMQRRPRGLTPADRPLGRAESCPFDITIADDGGGGLVAAFRAGTINNLLPDNYLTGVAVPASGNRHLVLSCTVSSGEITAATFAALTDPPTAIAPSQGMPPTSFDLLIGVTIDGVATKIISCGNIQASIVEAFRTQKVAPAAGELPYDVHYTWEFSII